MKGRVGSRALLMETDGRTAWARRYKDLCALLISDAGGIACLSELKLGLIRRAATLMLSCEKLETDIAEGRDVDLDQLGRLIGHARRVAETLGLDRVTRDITPTLAEIVAQHPPRYQPRPPWLPKKPANGAETIDAVIVPADASDASAARPEPSGEASSETIATAPPEIA